MTVEEMAGIIERAGISMKETREYSYYLALEIIALKERVKALEKDCCGHKACCGNKR